MTNTINWEKQYIHLEIQMREMMKMSLKLASKIEFRINDIIYEVNDNEKLLVVLATGENAVYQYELYNTDKNIILKTEETYKNSFDIRNFKNVGKIKVYLKNCLNGSLIDSKEYVIF